MNPDYCLPDLWVMHSILGKRQQEAPREAHTGADREADAAGARDFQFERSWTLGPRAVRAEASV